MSEKRRKYDQEFREGAVRIVRETGKAIAQVARDLGINEGTLGHWYAQDRAERDGTSGLSVEDIAELKRLRSENAELRMERDVLKRSVVLWVLSRVRDNTHLAYPFNRSSLGRWMLLVLACTTRGPRASSRPGSGPMPTASIIWRGCAGLRVSRVRTVAREVAGAWVMVGSCARGVVGVLL